MSTASVQVHCKSIRKISTSTAQESVDELKKHIFWKLVVPERFGIATIYTPASYESLHGSKKERFNRENYPLRFLSSDCTEEIWLSGVSVNNPTELIEALELMGFSHSINKSVLCNTSKPQICLVKHTNQKK